MLADAPKIRNEAPIPFTKGVIKSSRTDDLTSFWYYAYLSNVAFARMKCIVLSGIYETKQTPDDISTCRIPSFNCVVLVSFKNVFIEHLIYSAALAVIVGMIFSRFTGRDPSWIIIAVAFVPDIDIIPERIHGLIRLGFPVITHHGDLHNIFVLMVFSLLFAAVLRWIGIRFIDGLICSVIGIAAHFFEDALVYNPAYAFLWPISTQVFGIGIMKETRNLFGIASSTVLLTGLILLAGAVLVRTLIEGRGWWRVFLQGGRMDVRST